MILPVFNFSCWANIGRQPLSISNRQWMSIKDRCAYRGVTVHEVCFLIWKEHLTYTSLK